MEHLLLSCIESRVENNRSFYGRFQLGPFDIGQGLTVANALRRTLLSELSGLALTAVEIEGASHEYSTLKGVRESVLDILLNLKQIVLTSEFQIQEPQIGFLQVQGPAIIRASDLKLPVSIQCVDPDQYIATLSYDGFLNMKFAICQGKNYIPFLNFPKKWQQTFQAINYEKTLQNNFSLEQSFSKTKSNILPIDAVFMPVNKVNFLLETDNESDQPKDHIILEIWTNGSIHPRQAIHDAAKILIRLFSRFQETRLMKSVFFNSPKLIQNKRANEKKLASLDIGNLDLSLRPYTCLKRANIHTVADLLQYSREELLLLKNFGKRSLEEVENNLHQIGLRLRNSNEAKKIQRNKEKI